MQFPSGICPTEESWENIQAGYSFSGGTVPATTVIDPRGHGTTDRFNAAGFPIEQVDAFGQKTVFLRDAGNQVLNTTDPLGWKTTMTYDAAGNVRQRLLRPHRIMMHSTRSMSMLWMRLSRQWRFLLQVRCSLRLQISHSRHDSTF